MVKFADRQFVSSFYDRDLFTWMSSVKPNATDRLSPLIGDHVEVSVEVESTTHALHCTPNRWICQCLYADYIRRPSLSHSVSLTTITNPGLDGQRGEAKMRLPFCCLFKKVDVSDINVVVLVITGLG
jgi:hypothetical protein